MNQNDGSTKGFSYVESYFGLAQKVLIVFGAVSVGGAGGILLGGFLLTTVIVGSNPATVGILAGLVVALLFAAIALLVMAQVERWWKRKQGASTESQRTQVPDSRFTHTPTYSVRPTLNLHDAPATPWRDVRDLPPVSIGYDFAFAPQNDARAEALLNQAKERFKVARAAELVGIKAFVANTNAESSVFSEVNFIKEAESVLEKLEHCFIEGCVISLLGVANNTEGKAVLESLLKSALRKLRIEYASDKKSEALRPYYDTLIQSLSKFNDECTKELKVLQQAFVEGRMVASVFVGELYAFEAVKVKRVNIPGYDESLWKLRKQFEECVAEYVEKASQIFETFKLENSKALARKDYDGSFRLCDALDGRRASVKCSREKLRTIKAAALLKKEVFNNLIKLMYEKYYELLDKKHEEFFQLIKCESDETERKEEAGIAARKARKKAERKASAPLAVVEPLPQLLEQPEAILQQSDGIASLSAASNVAMFSAPVDQQTPDNTTSLPTAENSTMRPTATYQPA